MTSRFHFHALSIYPHVCHFLFTHVIYTTTKKKPRKKYIKITHKITKKYIFDLFCIQFHMCYVHILCHFTCYLLSSYILYVYTTTHMLKCKYTYNMQIICSVEVLNYLTFIYHLTRYTLLRLVLLQ